MKLTAKCPIHKTKMTKMGTEIKYFKLHERYCCKAFPDCKYYIEIIEPTYATLFKKPKIKRRKNR